MEKRNRAFAGTLKPLLTLTQGVLGCRAAAATTVLFLFIGALDRARRISESLTIYDLIADLVSSVIKS